MTYLNCRAITLVVLPGFIHASYREQGDRDIETVRKIVRSFMNILAAENSFANHIILHVAKKIDPSARRTLGIITN